MAGKLGELLERLKGILRRLVELIEKMMGESAVTDTGMHVRVPETPKPTILESRAREVRRSVALGVG